MISFVVLHYLVSDETIKTVNSILNCVPKARVFVVDNCSPNQSYQHLVEEFASESRVRVIQHTSNAGYAKGINFGYDFAKSDCENDFIIVMNNDMELVQQNFLELVEEAYQRTFFDILGPDIYSTAIGKHQNPEKTFFRKLEDVEKEIQKIEELKKKQATLQFKSILKQSRFVERIYYYFKKKRYSSQFINQELTDVMLHGSFYVFSKNFITRRDYALFPGTDFYCEAQILDYEAQRDNLKRVYCPQIKVLHHEDKATNAVAGNHAEKMNRKYERLLSSLSVFKELMIEDKNSGSRM